MITTTMTYEEIVNEVKKDKAELREFANKTFSHKKYVKLTLKHDGRFNFKHITWKSNRNNMYLILPYSVSKAVTKKKGMVDYVAYCYYFDSHSKLNFVLEDDRGGEYTFVTSHFLDRYAERFLKDDTLSKIDVMVKYIKGTGVFWGIEVNRPDYENSMFMMCGNGVNLGTYITPQIIVFRTYITFDMLKGSEFEEVNECVKRILKLEKEKKNFENQMHKLKKETLSAR